MRKIKVGSRSSALARVQSEWVIERIRRANPDAEVELITMSTEGDRRLSERLADIGGKGLFTKELEEALLSGEIDIAVHSLKDMPFELDPRLPILAYSHREDCRDALVLRDGAHFDGGRAGCSSARRRVQLKRLFWDARVLPVRGNVNTRLNKLDSGEFDFLVLAAAGLIRLGLSGRISRVLEPDEMLPSAGQGVLAVQGRSGGDYSYLGCVHDPKSAMCAMAEREFVGALGGGCTLPVGAYARSYGAEVRLDGMYADEEKGIFIRRSAVFNKSEAMERARELAEKVMKEAGL